jgi:hypothetical protein
MEPDQQQWHWQEGNKYALECMKALLWPNGGAPIALLTFIANRGARLTPEGIEALSRSLIFFAIGVLGSVVLFAMAYFTQLYFGNEGFTPKARRFHWFTYIPLALAFAGFCVGMWFAKNAVIAALSSVNIPPAWFGWPRWGGPVTLATLTKGCALRCGHLAHRP